MLPSIGISGAHCLSGALHTFMPMQVTTTNQETGEVGKEPLMTLGKYRWAHICGCRWGVARSAAHSSCLVAWGRAERTDQRNNGMLLRLHLPSWHP